jgi:hypothetical protein
LNVFWSALQVVGKCGAMRLDPVDLKSVEPIHPDGYHPAGNSICHTPDGSPVESSPPYTLAQPPITVAKNVEPVSNFLRIEDIKLIG